MIILDIQDIKLKSVNNKYNYNPKTKKMFLKEEYRDFKNLISRLAKKKKVKPPYKMKIEMKTALDIDNPVKAIMDGLQLAGVIENDSHVLELQLKKVPAKRNEMNKLKIEVESLCQM